MIKAIVFDLDDTLISEQDYIKSGFKSVASILSKQHDIEENILYDTMLSLFEEDSKNIFNRLLDGFNIDYSVEYIKKLINDYRSHKPNIKLYDDAREILDYLNDKNIRLGMITDGYKITQRNKLEVLNIEKHFECIVVTDELGREFWKPHQKPYDIVKNALNLEYSQIVYVGDNVNKDFITANKLGMYTVMIDRKNGIYSNIDMDKEYKAKKVITNLNELIEIL